MFRHRKLFPGESSWNSQYIDSFRFFKKALYFFIKKLNSIYYEHLFSTLQQNYFLKLFNCDYHVWLILHYFDILT